jgi:hypothetical protein
MITLDIVYTSSLGIQVRQLMLKYICGQRSMCVKELVIGDISVIFFICNHLDSGLHFFRTLPNVVVEWLTLLLSIREVPASNLGLESGYP